MTTEQNTVSIEYGFDHSLHLCPRHALEWALGFIPDHLQSALGELARPVVAQFSYESPRELHRLRFYFGDELEFNAVQNRLIYPRSILTEPNGTLWRPIPTPNYDPTIVNRSATFDCTSICLL